MEPTCPTCHTIVRPTDYFCFNCGKNLHAKKLPTTKTAEYLYYLASILLPPLGFWWAYKYYVQEDRDSKRIALVCSVLTVVSTIITLRMTMQLMNTVQSQVNEQIQSIRGY